MCLVSGAFSGQARYQAEMLNLPDVRVSYVRHPISTASAAELVQKTEESWSVAEDALKTNNAIADAAWVADAPQGCST